MEDKPSATTTIEYKEETSSKSIQQLPEPKEAHVSAKPEVVKKAPSTETAEEQIKRQFVILDPAVGSQVNTPEIYDSWKAHKEKYALIKEWEVHRHRTLTEIKKLLDNACESIFTALSTAISNNKNLVNYFVAISSSLKEFSKQMSKVPDLLSPVVELHSKENMSKLFNSVAKSDKDFAKNAADLAKYIDTVILSDVKGAIITYNKNVNAQKEVYPKLSKSVGDTEGKVMGLFHAYTAAVNNKELQILGGQAGNELDLWLPLHQYSLVVKQQASHIMKYAQFCENLIEDRRNLETTRVNSCNKSLENYFQQHKAYFGQCEAFATFLPSVCFFFLFSQQKRSTNWT
eukprot:TRINITY_DN2365_c0_g1_i1.p8 TRINITY_DN2365_c0_g1~~TRINITY_DN2365_c0_g1_i1.p8  ORF type:complete len:376 (-),score=41.10 TRINITY_DN2365_c0_g1_i1:14952-15986(-)